jgi:hypothetical protein
MFVELDRLYDKYAVIPTDGRGKPGAKYFVLDYVNDPSARKALVAYADACSANLPGLSEDLKRELERVPEFAEDAFSNP